MVNAQQWLNINYPKNTRKSIKALDLNNKNLEGDLNLKDFTNLETLDCAFNRLTSIIFGENAKKLQALEASGNFLTRIDFSQFQELTVLNIFNNNFIAVKLSCFSHLAKLKKLWIGNYDEEKIKQNIYNRFHGSLEPLKSTSLEEISLHNTDIDSGMEFLPDSLNFFYCQNWQRPNAKIKEVMEILKNYRENDRVGLPRQYNIQKWKQDNAYLIEKVKKNNEAEKQLKSLQKKLQTAEINNNALQQELKSKQNELKMLQGNDLAYKNFAYGYLQSKKDELESFIENIKEKLASKNLKKTFERFLNDSNESDQKKLEKTSAWEEINYLLIKQKKISELEVQLNSLQIQEQLAQVQIPSEK